jgi:uncharacterized protein (TIGR02996 family)
MKKKAPSPAAGFLDAICASPDDDTDRLIYADWLDDHGDADRAAFIRAQCALARLDPADPDWIDQRVTEHRLLGRHRAAWVKGVPRWMRQRVSRFRRGFPSGLQCPVAMYLRHHPDLPRRTVIDDLELTEALDVAALLTVPHLTRVRRFASTGTTGLGPLLAAMPGLLRFRGFYNDLLDEVALPASLRTLHVTVSPEQLSRPFDLPSLETLWLRYAGPEAMNLGPLLASPVAPSLVRLLVPEYLDQAAIDALAGSGALAGLRELCVGIVPQGEPQPLCTLIRSPRLAGLTALHLNHVDDVVLAALAEAPLTRRLRSLSLWPTRHDSVTAAGLARLVESGALDNLVRLGLSTQCPIDELLGVLAGTRPLPRLGYLSLFQLSPTEESFRRLSDSAHLPGLRAVSAYESTAGEYRFTLLPPEWWWDHV